MRNWNKNRNRWAAPAVLALTLALSGCDTVDRDNAVLGGAAGAVIGGVATGSLEGAAVGGAIGASAAVLLGRVANSLTDCRYRNRRTGRVFIARCR
ncbi:MAG: hypothetical protein KDJ80_13435 [Nitratireductor sp.]|nr:hypothetical protein [Nitratireductor sp.]